MNREETAQLLAMMKSVWPNHPTPEPEAMVTAYWMGLDDVSADSVTHAFRAHLKDPQRGRYFPTVADLRAAMPPAPLAPALPVGRQEPRPMRTLYRVFDADLNDYVELDEPILDTDPRYRGLNEQSDEALREAGRRDRERRGVAA